MENDLLVEDNNLDGKQFIKNLRKKIYVIKKFVFLDDWIDYSPELEDDEVKCIKNINSKIKKN